MIFINPDCYQGYRFPSMGMLSMAACLLRDGRRAEYIDANYDRGWKQRLAAAAPDHDWIGITANVLSIGPAIAAAEYIREAHPDNKIIMGGPYPSARYEELIPQYADAVAVGEAEETVLELESGRPLTEIAGLAYAHNGGVKFNGRRALIEDIDALPFPAWQLGDVKKYRLSHALRNPVLPVMTSRGCPFNCIFCASDLIFENRIRYRNIDLVLEEIDEHIYRHGAREIHVWDDNFTLNRNRTVEICEGIIKRKYRRVSFMIPAGIKPDIGDYEMFRVMRRAGFYFVCVAVETGDQEIMNKLGKKVKVDRVREVVAAARRAGILTNGFFMLGLPWDTESTMLANIDHACSLPLHQALFFIVIPFPGTELYDIACGEGRLLYHNERKMYEQGYFLGRAAYEMPGRFDAETLERMYRIANRRFFYRPRIILELLGQKIRAPKKFFHAAYKFIKIILQGRQF